MRSLSEISLKRIFRLRTELYSESDPMLCFGKLGMNESDLVIAGQSVINQFKGTGVFQNADVLNLAEYGYGEPKRDWVDKVIAKANEIPYRRIIAVGGGATIDIAKLCIFGDGRSVKQLFADKSSLTKRRELIAIPTTCGTGSEVTNVSVVEFEDLNSKLGLQIDELFPDRAILVDGLLQSLPYRVFAVTSIDALAHAVESLLSPKADEFTDMYAKTAIEGIIENLTEVQTKRCLPKDLQKSLICANMAGIAFSIAGCATMHALSFPLGSNYRLAHGEAINAVFGGVLQYYRSLDVKLDKLEKILMNAFGSDDDPIQDLLDLLNDVYDCPDLKALGVTKRECKEMAASVYENQQRLLVNSPITLNADDLANIYITCL